MGRRGRSPLVIACERGIAGVVQILCSYGAGRLWHRGPAEACSPGVNILRLLERTRAFVSPLQCRENLTGEPRSRLCSERLRDFSWGHVGAPRFAGMQLDYRAGAHVDRRMPKIRRPSSQRRAVGAVESFFLFIPWQEKGLPGILLLKLLIPFVIARSPLLRWSK